MIRVLKCQLGKLHEFERFSIAKTFRNTWIYFGHTYLHLFTEIWKKTETYIVSKFFKSTITIFYSKQRKLWNYIYNLKYYTDPICFNTDPYIFLKYVLICHTMMSTYLISILVTNTTLFSLHEIWKYIKFYLMNLYFQINIFISLYFLPYSVEVNKLWFIHQSLNYIQRKYLMDLISIESGFLRHNKKKIEMWNLLTERKWNIEISG